MKNNCKAIHAFLILTLASGVAIAQGMMDERKMIEMHKMMDHSMQRHHSSMRPGGIPDPYSSMTNPLPPSEENRQKGGELFQTHCATCHGKEGKGDGPAGVELRPRPANLTRFLQMQPLSRDSYLMWTISEGGVKFQTAMPPFKALVSEEDRWRIIHFLRTL